MSTINISLTDNQVTLVNNLISRYGFANRSEFFRSVLRVITRNPAIIEQADSIVFSSPSTYNTKDIVSGFKQTNKYSKEFIKDLETGLSESPYFNNK